MLDNILTLLMLILLQAVLGIDNLLYISLESQNAPKDKQQYVRNVGIGAAIFLRLGLLFLLVKLIQYFQDPIFSFNTHFITGEFNIHSLIVYFGGGFIMYSAIKSIWHLIGSDEIGEHSEKKEASTGKIITLIIIMNVVFSFDSILSAIALTDVFWVMAAAIVVGGLLMIWVSGKVSAFLQKNKMFEVLGLFILFLVGIMLTTEAAHISKLQLFGSEIHAMSKSTFYFVLAILIIVDVIQTKYHKKIMKNKQNS